MLTNKFLLPKYLSMILFYSKRRKKINFEDNFYYNKMKYYTSPT